MQTYANRTSRLMAIRAARFCLLLGDVAVTASDALDARVSGELRTGTTEPAASDAGSDVIVTVLAGTAVRSISLSTNAPHRYMPMRLIDSGSTHMQTGLKATCK